MNKGNNNNMLCPLFIYGNQFQTTINPLPDVPSAVGKGNQYPPY